MQVMRYEKKANEEKEGCMGLGILRWAYLFCGLAYAASDYFR